MFKVLVNLIVIVVLLVAPVLAQAQNSPSNPCFPGREVNGVCLPERPPGAINIETLSDLIIRILNIALTVVGLVSVLFVVFGGFKYVTSGGDPEQIESAKGMIMNALIGLVIVLLALVIVRVVANAIVNQI